MHGQLRNTGSSEDGPKDEEKLSTSALEYREEREKTDAYLGPIGLGGPSKERPFHLSMEKVLEHVM